MTIEEQVQDLQRRVTALEAKQGTPLKMGDGIGPDDLFGGKAGSAAPKTPIDPELERVFGPFYLEDGTRRFPVQSPEETTWLEHQKAFGGIIPVGNWEDGVFDALHLLIDHYAALKIEAMPELILYSGTQWLVFPSINGCGFGTVNPLRIGAKNFLLDARDRKADWTISQIEKRRAK